MKPAYGVKNSTGVNFGRASKPNSVGELTTFPSRIPKSRLGREIFSQHIDPLHVCEASVGDDSGDMEGRQYASPVVLYRKYTKWTMFVLCENRLNLKRSIRGGAIVSAPFPLDSHHMRWHSFSFNSPIPGARFSKNLMTNLRSLIRRNYTIVNSS